MSVDGVPQQVNLVQQQVEQQVQQQVEQNGNEVNPFENNTSVFETQDFNEFVQSYNFDNTQNNQDSVSLFTNNFLAQQNVTKDNANYNILSQALNGVLNEMSQVDGKEGLSKDDFSEEFFSNWYNNHYTTNEDITVADGDKTTKLTAKQANEAVKSQYDDDTMKDDATPVKSPKGGNQVKIDTDVNNSYSAIVGNKYGVGMYKDGKVSDEFLAFQEIAMDAVREKNKDEYKVVDSKDSTKGSPTLIAGCSYELPDVEVVDTDDGKMYIANGNCYFVEKNEEDGTKTVRAVSMDDITNELKNNSPAVKINPEDIKAGGDESVTKTETQKAQAEELAKKEAQDFWNNFGSMDDISSSFMNSCTSLEQAQDAFNDFLANAIGEGGIPLNPNSSQSEIITSMKANIDNFGIESFTVTDSQGNTQEYNITGAGRDILNVVFNHIKNEGVEIPDVINSARLEANAQYEADLITDNEDKAEYKAEMEEAEAAEKQARQDAEIARQDSSAFYSTKHDREEGAKNIARQDSSAFYSTKHDREITEINSKMEEVRNENAAKLAQDKQNAFNDLVNAKNEYENALNTQDDYVASTYLDAYQEAASTDLALRGEPVREQKIGDITRKEYADGTIAEFDNSGNLNPLTYNPEGKNTQYTISDTMQTQETNIENENAAQSAQKGIDSILSQIQDKSIQETIKDSFDGNYNGISSLNAKDTVEALGILSENSKFLTKDLNLNGKDQAAIGHIITKLAAGLSNGDINASQYADAISQIEFLDTLFEKEGVKVSGYENFYKEYALDALKEQESRLEQAASLNDESIVSDEEKAEFKAEAKKAAKAEAETTTNNSRNEQAELKQEQAMRRKINNDSKGAPETKGDTSQKPMYNEEQLFALLNSGQIDFDEYTERLELYNKRI